MPQSDRFDVMDVIIIGAGPAGAWAAYRLATAGARVGIIDGSHPREKPCGGGITGRALAIVRPALDPRAVSSVEIGTATFTHRNASAQVDLQPDNPDFPALVVTGRRDLDGALLSSAVAAGAELIPRRVTEITGGDPRWTVRTRRDMLHASWLIGADGANSFVRRQVLKPFPRSELSIATGAFVRGHSSRDIVVAFEDDPPGYLWSFPRPDHLAIGICAQADQGTSAALSQRVNRWIGAHVGPGASVERYSWPIPSLGERALDRERPAGPRWMLLGDAAGLVDPITREGIYFALRSADFAADALLGSRAAAERYCERVRADIYSELRRAARLKARFFRPHFIDLLVSALSRSARIRAVMADLVAGQQTYAGLRRRLLKTFELRLMLELFGIETGGDARAGGCW
jgi:geranylgeranyl reductase family protein